MKQQLTEEDRRALVIYRLERARETMKEVPSQSIIPKLKLLLKLLKN